LNKLGLYIILVFSFFYLNCTKTRLDNTKLTDSSKNTTQTNNQPGIQQQNTTAGDKNTVQNSSEELVIKTSDGKEISAKYLYSPDKKETSQPIVVLIHQFMQTKDQWKSDFTDSLIAAGYKVLAYDIRGHGKSSKIEGELSSLLSDPEQAPKDIQAVVSWAREQKGIDSARIAAIGTSIGGNLALYAELNLGIKLSVAVSNGKKTFEAFTGYNELMMGRPYFPRIKNVLLICGSKDGDHEQGQKWIYENFLEDPKEMKVYDSDKHGKSLIEQFPEINTLILSWLKKNL
jgi:pimeloyl-ACP methyl ester carboxylesterase